MSDIYSDSVYVQIKSPCKKRFPSPFNLILNGKSYYKVCPVWLVLFM